MATTLIMMMKTIQAMVVEATGMIMMVIPIHHMMDMMMMKMEAVLDQALDLVVVMMTTTQKMGVTVVERAPAIPVELMTKMIGGNNTGKMEMMMTK